MNADPDLADEDEEDEEPPGLWTSFFTALRLIVGWFCVALGVLNLLVEVDMRTGDPDIAYFVFHSMLFVGGLLLLSLGWLNLRPGVPGYTAFGAVLAGGMVVSGIPVTNTVCCMSAFAVRHGWPFSFMARNDGRWHVDSQHLLADLLFWGFAGLILMVLVSLVRRVFAAADQDQAPARHARSTHAEPRTDPATEEVSDPFRNLSR